MAADQKLDTCLVGMGRYTKLEKCGEGSFGVVYKARDLVTQDLVALKQFRKEIEDADVLEDIRIEISILQELRHPNIVKLLEVFYDRATLFMVFDFMDMDLGSRMVKPSISPSMVKSYLYQILSGVAFCHENRIFHGDLKPKNLLLNIDGQLQLCDFGLAGRMDQHTYDQGTLWYCAPEILLGLSSSSTTADLWSIGCIFAEMVTRRPLFAGDFEKDQLFEIFRVLGTPNDDIWPGVSQLPHFKQTFPQWNGQVLSKVVPHMDATGLDLLSKLVAYPNKRISAPEALKHPYFS